MSLDLHLLTVLCTHWAPLPSALCASTRWWRSFRGGSACDNGANCGVGLLCQGGTYRV